MSAYKFDIEPFESDFEFKDTFESFDEFAERVKGHFPGIRRGGKLVV